ncbi:FeoA domain-containing protein [Candidatus Symbiopectobacterium sp.]|uniref:FeoA family protein n=1 Tax=Candidatus Symbiopectobacterium sp. TaxID=2816440 RepID=UPI0025C6EAA8|nr:FeoA domain-containing protein [Candidatus Symbiopectobacterium sp.]
MTEAVFPVGSSWRVQGYQKGSTDYRKRLLALGVTPGVIFTVTRVAPLGDPVELRLRGAAISVRKSEAQILILEPALLNNRE